MGIIINDMRDIKTLLTLLRDHIQIHGVITGLCSELYVIRRREEMTWGELQSLEYYLDTHEPLCPLWHPYWWKPGNAAPRVRWLNRQIKKQGSFCSPANKK
jgi:hypothetical protein